jgi:hypothetical protein
MPAYTAYNIILEASSVETESGIVDDFSQAGTQHSRVFHSTNYFRFDLTYSMTKAQFDSICAAYDANPRANFTGFEYHSVSPIETYTVKFLARPRITDNLGLNRFFVSVQLRGTLD